jgi:hypothetical protein
MSPKTFSLPLRIALDSKIIKSSLTNGDGAGDIGQGKQIIDRRFLDILIVRVNADRTEQVLPTRDDGTQARQVFKRDGDTECMGDPRRSHALQNGINVLSKIGEIEMAVRVDKHVNPLPP